MSFEGMDIDEVKAAQAERFINDLKHIRDDIVATTEVASGAVEVERIVNTTIEAVLEVLDGKSDGPKYMVIPVSLGEEIAIQDLLLSHNEIDVAEDTHPTDISGNLSDLYKGVNT